ncbi:aldo/keto reductase [[Limnothrix rosea] IAM M-220]|uniref:aldo/keto reductase n=1 Tax=[Limnothrix rosea] IAM M-220 TaxID=454133 RepID=UPI0009689392|nr:aldo/keto reductase [[Limnothrix rosea] IAM M-220]OKH17094.1 aldo/keto reductase [[Limnothrix rosea] IAM M-220]
MEKRQLGSSDVFISPIIMGTWQAGKRNWADIKDSDIVAAIRAAVDNGISTIDTAEIYGDGYAEQRVAEAIADRRDQVELLTKVFANHLKYDDVLEACDRSLKNLQTDYLDLYQIHWPSGSWGYDEVPMAETMTALTKLKADGKIRAIGVSNFSAAQIAEASEYGKIDSVQPPYSLFWRAIEKELQPYCVEHNISIISYSSLAQGFLTGKFDLNHKFAEGDHRFRNRLYADKDNYQRVQTALDHLRPIAATNPCTLAQLALAWLIQQPQTSAIVGARNAEQAIANAGTLQVELSEGDLEKINKIGRTVTEPLDDNPMLWDWS